jgi:methyl-accepting chemotaxis protein
VITGASALHQKMYDDRIDKLRAVVQGVRSFANGLEAQVAAGKLSHDQAVTAVREYAHAMRFDHGDGYVTMSGFDGIYLINGADPSRENKRAAAAAFNAGGKTIADMVVDSLRNDSDEGVISYAFPKPGQAQPQPKIAYIARFDPWKGYFLAGAYTDDLDAEFRARVMYQAMSGGVIVLLVILAGWLINGDISRGLEGLGATMHKLASGDLKGAIPGLGRPDELGAMAKSVQVFKDNMIEADRLLTEQAAQKQEATRERRQAMLDLATKFEASVGGIVKHVASAASRLKSTAESISATSEETTRRSVTVAGASEQAARNVQTVASAAEELSASVREIAHQ